MKTTERAQARRLRVEGHSIKEIASLVGVSASSVSTWVRDIALTEGARTSLDGRNPARNGEIVRQSNLRRALERRKVWQDNGRRLARANDSLHRMGCMLYWAEGSRSSQTVEFVNSDPAMIRLFVEFLTTCYGAPRESIRLRCHLFADHAARQAEVERFWLGAAGLPESSLRRSIVNRYSRSSSRKRIRRLPYGTCRICLHRAEVVQSIHGAIQEYGGFERPEWLG